MTSREQAIFNALEKRHGVKWSMDVADMVDHEVSTADGKDTARKLAARVAKAIKQRADA